MRSTVKLNLGLHILGRRPDGFHEIETLFVPNDAYSDELSIKHLCEYNSPSGAYSRAVLDDGTIVEIAPCSWDPSQDLTVKAYRLLKEEFGLPPVCICLEKGAPVGAGLGGGSADCAAALLRLNELFALGLSREELAERAARLGSDCAFFVYGRTMLGRGRGEILTPFELDLSEYELRVDIPAGESVSTSEAYRGVWDAVRAAYPSGRIQLPDILALPVEQWQGRLCNDFELTVFPSHPRIAELKQRMLDEGAIYASMSGSGAAVFGIFRKR